MNVEFVNPFLDALINVLKTMANVDVTYESPCLKADSVAMGYITGMIGLAGERTSGSIAITFTEEAVLHIASNMLGEKFTEVNAEVADMVGEITNMVSGGGRKILSEEGYKFNMAIPTTIVGRDHTVTHRSKGTTVLVPFKTPAGPFYVEISFEEVKPSAAYNVRNKVIYKK
ncbi:chemotaxis protein CheX [Candidatus Magnetomonas plexicatena]|uniref:chemotaxis protein CheX n=1 Tax=Candidatus Magnetomonas plexicatena TaxID=2552947 RepID=UPI001C74C203|nr:chemotaxis protein CheX [Nitrospirales bacterium LBB_01]